MLRFSVSLSLALASAALIPAGAAADGLPVPVDGSADASVVAPDGSGPRYATVYEGGRTTVLQIDQSGGEITGSKSIKGQFGVPLVSVDGTAAGLSADGGRLVLINPRARFPRRETSFRVMDIDASGRMRPGLRLRLRGDFSFDALSPDGSTLYLIQYPSRDPNEYLVREYDLARSELVNKPVLVPDEAPGEMRGLPTTRVSTSDGRWEFTLYDGGGDGEPFIHGLDTVEGTSVCIDLPQLESADAYRSGLSLDPSESTIDVTGRHDELLATVDTETFAVSDPPAPAAAGNEGGGLSAVAVGAITAGVALLAGLGFLLRRRRRHDEPPEDPFEADEQAPDAEPERELDRV